MFKGNRRLKRNEVSSYLFSNQTVFLYILWIYFLFCLKENQYPSYKDLLPGERFYHENSSRYFRINCQKTLSNKRICSIIFYHSIRDLLFNIYIIAKFLNQCY